MKNRGFEIVSKYEKQNINIPKRASSQSAGYDFEAANDVKFLPGEAKLVETGIKAYMLKDEVLKIFIRSSLALKGLMLANNVGIIDADYYNNPKNEGHIMILMYNYGKKDVNINKGERIAQGIFDKYLVVDNEISVNRLRSGGFGSTNK